MKFLVLRFTPLVLVAVFAFFPLTAEAQEPVSRIKTKIQIVSEARESIRQITAKEVKELMSAKKNFILIDVRTERERNAGYISGSVWLPRGVLEFKIPELCKDAEKKIIVYCRKGGRSILAAYALEQMGYQNVLNLEGGINAWGTRGYSLYNWHGEIKVAGFDKQDPNPSNYDIFKN